jgi:predicted ABC-type transport system involved in lysophospholipase L1 biosynthesis ATPase subunit
VLSVEELHKRFTTDRGEIRAVEGVSFTVEEGRFYTLLGPSGCGKTTTLRCIAGLERPEGGRITIAGAVVSGNGTFVPPQARGIGMVFQSYAIWPHMNVFDNVAYPLKVARPRPSRAQIDDAVREALVLVGLAAELARGAGDEAEDAAPEKQEAAADEAVRRAHVGPDRVLDRRVRQRELERSEHAGGSAEAERDDDLVRLSAPLVRRHPRRDATAEGAAEPRAGLERVADRGPIVGVEDAAAPVPQRHPVEARGLQAGDRPVERDQVGLAEPVAELVRRQLGLERGRDEDPRLTRVRVRARADLVREVLREPDAEQGDREEADEGEGGKQARPPAA